MATNICKFCEQPFEHDRSDVDVCRSCWYSGKTFEAKLPKTLEALRTVNANAGVSHTGGGCFVLEVPVSDVLASDGYFERYVYLTTAEGEMPESDEEAESTTWLACLYDYRVHEGCEPVAEINGQDFDTTVGWLATVIAAEQALDEVKADTEKEPQRFAKWDGKTVTSLQDCVDVNSYLSDFFEEMFEAGGIDVACLLTNCAFEYMEARWQHPADGDGDEAVKALMAWSAKAMAEGEAA